jgi:hypothetical protein
MSTLSGGPNIVSNGLILNLDAANTKSYISGSTAWNDISRGGNNGTLTNGPTFNTGSGGSIVFDGVDDYVLLNTLSTLVGTSNVSIECWFYNNTTTSGFQNIVGQFNGSSGWLIHTSTNVNQKIIVLVGGGTAYGGVNNTPTGAWFNTVLVYDGTLTGDTNKLKMYINGIYRTYDTWMGGTVPSTWPNATSVNVAIGSLLGYGRYFNGNIPIIRIYNRTLTSQEVLQNYNATKGRFGL